MKGGLYFYRSDYARMQFLARFYPLAIQVHPCQIAARVTVNDTVRVEHRHDLKDKVVSQDSGTKRRAYKVIYHALHHVRSACFSWMHAGRDYNTPPLTKLLHSIHSRRSEARDNEHIHVVTGECLTKDLPSKTQLLSGIGLKSIQISLQVTECIGVTVCEVHGVTLVWELHRERQSVIVSLSLALHGILVVTNVAAGAVPSLTKFARLDLRIHQWLHPVVVQAIRL